jgi:prolyl 4-hydroxylase
MKLEYSFTFDPPPRPAPVRGHAPQAFVGNRFAIGEREPRIAFSVDWPRIALLEGMLADDECSGLVEVARARLTRSTVFEHGDGTKSENPGRSSQSATFERAENELVARVEARICALAGLAPELGERMEVVRYGVTEEYLPHYDWFDPATPPGKKQLEAHGQRIATVILYLSDVEGGGATVFPHLGITIRPRRGNALYFWNLDRHGYPEPLTLHAGAPIERGEKTIVTKWFRERPWIEPPLP